MERFPDKRVGFEIAGDGSTINLVADNGAKTPIAKMNGVGRFSTSPVTASTSLTGRIESEVDGNTYTMPTPAERAAIAPAGTRILLVGDSYVAANNVSFNTTGITSMVRASGVCTVVIASHTLSTGRKIAVQKVPEAGFNGYGYTITRVDANTFTFPCPGEDATATLTSASLLVTDWLSNYGAAYWANGYLGGGLTFTNRGVGGYTTEQVLAVVTAELAEGTYDEVWNISGTNDMSRAVPSAQFTIDNITAMAALCASYGKIFRTATMMPLGSTATAFAISHAYIRTVNAAIRALPYTYPNTKVADVYGLIVNPQDTTNPGAAKAAMLKDAIHPSQEGARAYGLRFAGTYETDPGSVKIRSYADYGNAVGSFSVLDSGPFVATGGAANTGTSGTVGANLKTERGSGTGTAVASVVTMDDGLLGQQLVITSTDASTFSIATATAQNTLIPARLTTGERRRMVARVKASGITAANFRDILLDWWITVGGVTYYYSTGEGNFVTKPVVTDFDVQLVGEYLTMPDVSTITAAGARLQIRTPGASGDALTVQMSGLGLIL